MAIDQEELRLAAQQAPLHKSLMASQGQLTGFLCHSHRDQTLAKGLQNKLRDDGLDLYIDWQDAEMPEKPTAETAQRLQTRIINADLFLFLATANSKASKWCPWELGYADGKKRIGQIAIVSTRDSLGNLYGNEYLALYRSIDAGATSLLMFERGGKTGNSVRALRIR